jgi:hypothetical protein
LVQQVKDIPEEVECIPVAVAEVQDVPEEMLGLAPL